MIFKPKVKQKLKNFLVRAPIITALALACLISVPMRADAADSNITLRDNMTNFVKIGNYDIIETTGENLNKMFDIKAHNKSELNTDRHYIAYFKIDRKKTGTTRQNPLTKKQKSIRLLMIVRIWSTNILKKLINQYIKVLKF